MKKRPLWMFMADLNNPDIQYIIPTLAWMAEKAGVDFECYLEVERSGQLFARTGSTVLGGYHHHQFNYLNCIFDVKYIIFGEVEVFRSSINIFNGEILVETDSIGELYHSIMTKYQIGTNEVLFASEPWINVAHNTLEIGPYIYPEIFFRQLLAFPQGKIDELRNFIVEEEIDKVFTIFLSLEEQDSLSSFFPDIIQIDNILDDDDYGSITLRIAERWKKNAEGLAFGDPVAILSLLPILCRERKIAVYGKKIKIPEAEVVVSTYTEEVTEIADEVIELSNEIGNHVLLGRQTGDGDLFYWSKAGICMQIMDPNRPAFPVVTTVPHIWAKTDQSLYDLEPDDETLERYAEEGKILISLIWHSGEMAHNEAMLNIFELAGLTGIKMGIGVHAARYETCPQLWELLNISRKKGGVKGLIEPLLHSGGMGVLAEVNCPPDILKQHCQEALKRINRLAGTEGTPKGYYAFMDSDLASLTNINDDIYRAIEDSGLEYIISSALPGRNRILRENKKSVVINQTCRSIASASPFVRITTVEELRENAPRLRPGWVIGALDAPVIAFNPYIWRHGSRFMKIVDWIKNEKALVNVLPHTIARYARILRKKGFIK